ncbi:MAG: Asp23/Gls24 family envelope stress response protein [Eubacteriales bacterium]
MRVTMENKYGVIEISGEVLGNLVGYAATACFGVVGMANKNKTDGIVNLLRRDAMDKGVRVETDGDQLVVDLHIMVEYGVNIPAISRSICNRVTYYMETTTGLKVKAVNVCVDAMRAQ